jgi:hypothetical protein
MFKKINDFIGSFFQEEVSPIKSQNQRLPLASLFCSFEDMPGRLMDLQSEKGRLGLSSF